MRTDHEELCGSSYGSFCLNGGICYVIPTVSSPFCRCIENYTGARCEEVLLPSLKTQIKSELFAAFLTSVVVLGILVFGAFYFLCRWPCLLQAPGDPPLGAMLSCWTSSAFGEKRLSSPSYTPAIGIMIPKEIS
ncbi:pro-neuregulin-4, membrane-bound isoform isoform X1 [Dermochelys coriacea]|uniref:pro-neuregulin-4, membrane-bound isoform isoform X1 n=1 Tax=Dermochelys coriacea TaxID=27794 RepID=UPI001CA80E61|nr:pro-neuregulin-4, membrane-bound isoform isoform X1 [Dermochelys coriacea]XP_043349794.1 pro-neuregulin-4, membrane-bound isoform isoform X1 [Dermochelys coriacea]